MLLKLSACYDLKSTASKITKMSELVTVWYKNLKDDFAKPIDGMAALLELFRSMKAKMDDSLAVGILVASITATDIKPIVAAIKSLQMRILFGKR